MDSLGLARAEVSCCVRDQVKAQYTMGEVDMFARLQDS